MPFCAWRRFSASSNTTDCGPVNDLVGDFIAPVCRETMHKNCSGIRKLHQTRVDLIGLDSSLCRRLAVLIAHRHPGISDDAVGACKRISSGSRPRSTRRRNGPPSRADAGLVVWRRRNLEAEVETRSGGVHPRRQHVVGVAGPRYVLAA